VGAHQWPQAAAAAYSSVALKAARHGKQPTLQLRGSCASTCCTQGCPAPLPSCCTTCFVNFCTAAPPSRHARRSCPGSSPAVPLSQSCGRPSHPLTGQMRGDPMLDSSVSISAPSDTLAAWLGPTWVRGGSTATANKSSSPHAWDEAWSLLPSCSSRPTQPATRRQGARILHCRIERRDLGVASCAPTRRPCCRRRRRPCKSVPLWWHGSGPSALRLALVF